MNKTKYRQRVQGKATVPKGRRIPPDKGDASINSLLALPLMRPRRYRGPSPQSLRPIPLLSRLGYNLPKSTPLVVSSDNQPVTLRTQSDVASYSPSRSTRL